MARYTARKIDEIETKIIFTQLFIQMTVLCLVLIIPIRQLINSDFTGFEFEYSSYSVLSFDTLFLIVFVDLFSLPFDLWRNKYGFGCFADAEDEEYFMIIFCYLILPFFLSIIMNLILGSIF